MVGNGLVCNYRPVLLLLRLAVKREYSSSMTVKRKKTFGRIKRSAMQLKWNPDLGMHKNKITKESLILQLMSESSWNLACSSSVRFGVSLPSGSSPKGSVRNGSRGRGSAKEGDDEDEEEQISPQAASSTNPTPQSPQSKPSSKLPLNQTNSVSS